jgi:hypothetical protein
MRVTGAAIGTNFSLVAASNTTVNATFSSLETLSVGVHTGTIEFYSCQDSNCSTFYSQTPAVLNYSVTVQAVTLISSLTPTNITATIEEGDAAQFQLSGQISIGNGNGTVSVSDTNGTFTLPTDQFYTGGNSTINLPVKLTLGVGTHAGTIALYVCNRPVTVCDANSDISASPLTIPYSITITPLQRLPTVTTLTGLPEWGTYQGNSGHTGYVPVTLDPTHFSSYWVWTLPNSAGNKLTPATTGSGKVVLSGSGYFSTSTLFALNEADGSLAWQYNFGSIFAVNPPAVEDGRVFVASSGHEDTFMWSFDLNGGALIYKTAFDSQWEHYLAPVVRDGYVYTDGGYYGGMYRFKERTGALNWFGELDQYELWSPAVDDQYAYADTGGEFVALDKVTGERIFAVTNANFNWWGYSLNIAPVLPGDGSVMVVDGIFDFGYAHQNNLIRFSVSGQAESWRVAGSFASDPVVANGTLYILNAATNAIEARSNATGSLLWSWVPSGASETIAVSNLVLTDNLIFVTTTAGTYAINLTTHNSVWNVAQTGRLALSSNKVLYIVSDTIVNAFKLN